LHVLYVLTRKIVQFYESKRDFDNLGWYIKIDEKSKCFLDQNTTKLIIVNSSQEII